MAVLLLLLRTNDSYYSPAPAVFSLKVLSAIHWPLSPKGLGRITFNFICLFDYLFVLFLTYDKGKKKSRYDATKAKHQSINTDILKFCSFYRRVLGWGRWLHIGNNSLPSCSTRTCLKVRWIRPLAGCEGFGRNLAHCSPVVYLSASLCYKGGGEWASGEGRQSSFSDEQPSSCSGK